MINTTTYTCTFSSQGCIVYDTVTVNVNSLPIVTLLATPSIVCIDEDVLLTATTSIPVNRYRFQYNSGSGWNNITIPAMVTNNPQSFNNIQNSTQFRVKVREENGCNTSSWSPIIIVPISTVNTQNINHN